MSYDNTLGSSGNVPTNPQGPENKPVQGKPVKKTVRFAPDDQLVEVLGEKSKKIADIGKSAVSQMKTPEQKEEPHHAKVKTPEKGVREIFRQASVDRGEPPLEASSSKGVSRTNIKEQSSLDALAQKLNEKTKERLAILDETMSLVSKNPTAQLSHKIVDNLTRLRDEIADLTKKMTEQEQTLIGRFGSWSIAEDGSNEGDVVESFPVDSVDTPHNAQKDVQFQLALTWGEAKAKQSKALDEKSALVFSKDPGRLARMTAADTLLKESTSKFNELKGDVNTAFGVSNGQLSGEIKELALAYGKAKLARDEKGISDKTLQGNVLEARRNLQKAINNRA